MVLLKTRNALGGILLVIMYFGLTATSVIAQQHSPESNVKDSLRQLIEEFLEENNLPGIALSVMQNGDLIFSGNAGYANLADSTRIENCCTLFRVGSVVKSMTSVIMMQLANEGILDIDKDIHTYYNDWPEKPSGVTCRRLANHTAGIRHYTGFEFMSNVAYDDIEAGLSIFGADTLASDPGESYLYSSYGYNLLGVVLEKASGQVFDTLLARRIFRPAGMRNSIPEDPASPDSHTTAFYMHNDQGQLIAGFPVNNTYKLPSGGLLASADDLVRFGQAVLRHYILSETALSASLQLVELADGSMSRYGLGWSMSAPDSDGPVYFGHGGGSVGGSTFLIILPDSDAVIAVISNCSGVPVAEVAFAAAKQLGLK